MGDPGLPDDWGMSFSNCPRCDARIHASEGGCGRCAQETEEAVEAVGVLNQTGGELMAEGKFEEAARLFEESATVARALQA